MYARFVAILCLNKSNVLVINHVKRNNLFQGSRRDNLCEKVEGNRRICYKIRQFSYYNNSTKATQCTHIEYIEYL
jgi:hypothetical protein